MMIGQILKKWQQFYEIQEGGSRHLEKFKVNLLSQALM